MLARSAAEFLASFESWSLSYSVSLHRTRRVSPKIRVINEAKYKHERNLLRDFSPKLGHKRYESSDGMLLKCRFWFCEESQSTCGGGLCSRDHGGAGEIGKERKGRSSSLWRKETLCGPQTRRELSRRRVSLYSRETGSTVSRSVIQPMTDAISDSVFSDSQGRLPCQDIEVHIPQHTERRGDRYHAIS